jgi:cytochrome P450
MPEVAAQAPALSLVDGEAFRTNAFWATLAHLRAHDPVSWHPEEDGFWAVTLYEDVVAVYRDTATYSSQGGMHLRSEPEAIAAVAGQMLIVSDPPRHTHAKRVLGSLFDAESVARFASGVDAVVEEALADALERETVDFVEVAALLPTRVICAALGVPRSQWDMLGAATTAAFEALDPAARRRANSEIFFFFEDLVASRKRRPGEDIVSRLHEANAADARAHGRSPLTDTQLVVNLHGVLSGANETTRYSAAGGVLEVARDVGLLTQLRQAEPYELDLAVEEVLRWTVPGLHAMRTVTRPARLRGRDLEPGDRVTIWNASANRDERVFERAHTFDLRRTPNRHLSFGSGRHLCLGARLGRLELRVLLRALGRSAGSLELVGAPEYNSSNFTWGLVRLPVRLGRRS